MQLPFVARRRMVWVMTTTKNYAALVEHWIAAANRFDRDAYLACFTDDAVLDDPSVGEVFRGKAGIAAYFDAYFAGYATQTTLVRTTTRRGRLHLDVHFVGEFPGGETDGVFDLELDGERISFVRAALA